MVQVSAMLEGWQAIRERIIAEDEARLRKE
jgi:hypothetical protein